VTVQGFRVEVSPNVEQRAAMGRHAGLSRVVENFCLDKIRAAFAQRAAEQTYGVPEAQLTKAPWSGIDLEKLWRAEHRDVAPWFAESGLSSRVPKEACRLRAAGLKNWWESKSGKRKGPRARFPTLRKRKHGSRFRYDADRAKPAGDRTISLPGVPGKVRSREGLLWLSSRLADGRARILGTTVRERAGRWWVTFQVDVDRTDVNERRTVDPGAPDVRHRPRAEDVRCRRGRHRRRGRGPGASGVEGGATETASRQQDAAPA
jgi:putative transposase